jgi:hypothetical protein
MEKTMTNNKITTVSDAGEIKASKSHYTIANLLEVLAETWITPEQWDAIRTAVGLQLDPQTAEAMWVYSDVPDGDKVAKEYFFRSPGSDEWMRFEDLPYETRATLAEIHHICN